MPPPTWTNEQYTEWQRRRSAVARIPDSQRQPDQRRESQDSKLEESPRRVVYCVGIISVRKSLVDEHDNLRTGAKPLIDAITASLGFANDNDPRLRWEYGQVVGTRPGTIVRIMKTLLESGKEK